MNLILEKLKQKYDIDKRSLRIYSIVDSLLSSIISLLSIASISVAIYALVALVHKGNEDKKVFESTSYILLMVLVVFIIFSFILTLTLIIYKYFDRSAKYKKIVNTLKYLDLKYHSNQISKADLEVIIDKLWEKATKKKKVGIGKILKAEFQRGIK
ncbi:hypothetical protein ACXYRP_03965 [Mycoplasma sp. 5912]